MPSALLDTGIWYALCDQKEPPDRRRAANRIYLALEQYRLIVPWPIVYETLRTGFAKNRNAMMRFERELRRPRVDRIDDARYRKDALRNAFDSALQGRPLSLVDCYLRLLMDNNASIKYFATFNPRDFADVCRDRRIEMLGGL